MMDLKSLVPFSGRALRPRAEGRDPFLTFRQEMDRLFDDVFTGAPSWRAFETGSVTPRLDVAETDKEMTVTVELPGVDEKDIELSLTGDVLIIKGEKREEREEKRGERHLSERSYGTFTRTLRLPFEADVGKIDASFDRGVLTVQLPKPKELQQAVRRIEIKKPA